MMMKEVGKANGPAKMLYATRRWTRAAIPLSKKCQSKERKFLHISNMHNNPGSTRIDRTQNERNLNWMFDDAIRMGAQPVLSASMPIRSPNNQSR